MLPLARRDHLIVQELDQETLVYDLERHEAHCLNRTAALIWGHCDAKTTVAGIASLLCQQHGLVADERLVGEALGQLERARLVQPGRPVQRRRSVSRRHMTRRLAVAAMVAPLVTTVVAPTAAMAASCGNKNDPCGPGLPSCCPDLVCKNGKCHNH